MAQTSKLAPFGPQTPRMSFPKRRGIQVCRPRCLSPYHYAGQAISWLGDSSQHGVSRVMDICRASSETLDVDAGPAPSRVSFQVQHVQCTRESSSCTLSKLDDKDRRLKFVFSTDMRLLEVSFKRLVALHILSFSALL